MSKPVALILIGCPASGKSSRAKETGYEIVERDLIREQISDGSRKNFYTKFDREFGESIVSDKIRTQLKNASKNKTNVVVSDTNINKAIRRALYSELFSLGFQIKVEMINTSLDVLISRNNNREVSDHIVPTGVIEQMYATLQTQMDCIKEEKDILNYRYQPVTVTKAINSVLVVDLDGTLAIKGNRSPYDLSKVGIDTIDHKVSAFVTDLVHRQGKSLAVLTGRDELCYTDTVDWLHKYTVFDIDKDYIFMRPTKNNKSDWLVKGRMILDYLENNPQDSIYMILDDRQQVVNVWSNMGFNVWQVNQHNF